MKRDQNTLDLFGQGAARPVDAPRPAGGSPQPGAAAHPVHPNGGIPIETQPDDSMQRMLREMRERKRHESALEKIRKECPVCVEFDDPLARHTDPETSHQAAEDATLRASKGRLLAMRALRFKGPSTDFELAASTGLQQTSVGKRRGECMNAGLVEPLTDETGEVVTRPAPSGSKATVWMITEAGRAWLAANEEPR